MDVSGHTVQYVYNPKFFKISKSRVNDELTINKPFIKSVLLESSTDIYITLVWHSNEDFAVIYVL